MFDKLFALVELSFVDTHTLTLGTGLYHDINRNFFPLFKTLLPCHIDLLELSTNVDYQNLVFIFETITLHQLCDNQQPHLYIYMNLVYLYYM